MGTIVTQCDLPHASPQIGAFDAIGQSCAILYRPNFDETVWNEVTDLLLTIPNPGEYTLDDILTWCQQGRAHLWVYYENSVAKMVMVTTFVEYPQMRYLHIMGLAGSGLKGAFRYWPLVERFMSWNGCQKATARVRPQIARVLKRYGFAQTHVLVARQSTGATNEKIH